MLDMKANIKEKRVVTYLSSSLPQYRIRRIGPIRRTSTITLQLSIVARVGILRSVVDPGPDFNSIPPYPITDAIVIRLFEGLLAYGARGVS